MNKTKKLTSSIFLALFICLGVASSTLHNQKANAQSSSTEKIENVVVFSVKLPESREVRATVIEGGALKIQKDNFKVEVYPVVNADKTVTFRVLEGKSLSKDNASSKVENSFDEIENFQLDIKNVSATTKTSLPIQIRLEATGKSISNDGEVSINLNESYSSHFQPIKFTKNTNVAARPDECCVVCDNVFYCSNCQMSAPCGSCCTQTCRDRGICS